jgi:hypothetical protein
VEEGLTSGSPVVKRLLETIENQHPAGPFAEGKLTVV